MARIAPPHRRAARSRPRSCPPPRRRPGPAATRAALGRADALGRAAARARYVVDLDSGRTIFASRAGHAAHPGLGREALHDVDRADASRRRRAPDHDACWATSASDPRRRPERQPLPARRRRPELRRARRRAALADQLVLDRGLREITGPRDRRRVGVRRAARRRRRRATATIREVGPLSALTFNRGLTGPARARTARPARRSSPPARSTARCGAAASDRRRRRATGRTPRGGAAARRAAARRRCAELARARPTCRRTTSTPRR